MMNHRTDLKRIVKEKYAQIAVDSETRGCCSPQGCGCSGDAMDYSVFADDYTGQTGYVQDADLGLGCGLPTEFAGIKEGDTVLDLGSGAGNDVFVARSLTGASGKVIGLDMTEEMIAKAERNTAKLGFTNVEFRLGDIEEMPFEDDSADVIISNCVLNLVPDKHQAFSEIYRVLRSGGHFCISDVVILGTWPPDLHESVELYTGCVSGALEKEAYLGIIRNAGFTKVEVRKSKPIPVPEEMLRIHLDDRGMEEYRQNIRGIFSITVTGDKNENR